MLGDVVRRSRYCRRGGARWVPGVYGPRGNDSESDALVSWDRERRGRGGQPRQQLAHRAPPLERAAAENKSVALCPTCREPIGDELAEVGAQAQTFVMSRK